MYMCLLYPHFPPPDETPSSSTEKLRRYSAIICLSLTETLISKATAQALLANLLGGNLEPARSVFQLHMHLIEQYVPKTRPSTPVCMWECISMKA